MLEQGDAAPDVSVQAADGSMVPLADLFGRTLVLYFYPKDDTSGCTSEGKDFSALKPEFDAAGADVVGISKNSPADHAKFIAKYDLKVRLVTDPDGLVCEAFDTWVQKSMYGRKYMGIDRATFLIDTSGKIVRIWRKVKVPGHAEEVLAAVRAIGSAGSDGAAATA
ncbi:MAG: alkyl hydroperoxide reductase [Sphingomonas bacterium]|nr:alkyl hydroperoxide reductase [Sphingomonas bacterium]